MVADGNAFMIACPVAPDSAVRLGAAIDFFFVFFLYRGAVHRAPERL